MAKIFSIKLIPGRRLSYDRALKIVQNEEYLSATDIDIIKRKEFPSESKFSKIRVRRSTSDINNSQSVSEIEYFCSSGFDLLIAVSSRWCIGSGPGYTGIDFIKKFLLNDLRKN